MPGLKSNLTNQVSTESSWILSQERAFNLSDISKQYTNLVQVFPFYNM